MLSKRRKKSEVLEEGIRRTRAILESTNVEMETINEYKQLKAELNK